MVPFFKGPFKYLLPTRDIIKRYGEDSWAVITGASDGIGKFNKIINRQGALQVISLKRI